MANGSIKANKGNLPPPGPAWSLTGQPGDWHPILPPPGPPVEPPSLPEGWTEPVDWTEGLRISWCLECGQDLENKSEGRPRKFCSNSHKNMYSRAKREWKDKIARMQSRDATVEQAKERYKNAGFTNREIARLQHFTRKYGPELTEEIAELLSRRQKIE